MIIIIEKIWNEQLGRLGHYRVQTVHTTGAEVSAVVSRNKLELGTMINITPITTLAVENLMKRPFYINYWTSTAFYKVSGL